MKKRKKSKKPFIILALIIILVVAFIIIKGKISEKNTRPVDDRTTANINNTEVNEKSAEEATKEKKWNESKKFKQTKEIKGLKISGISFSESDGKAELKAIVTNVSGKDIKDYTYFKITFLTEDGNEIGTIPGIINPIEKNATTELKATIRGKTEDYINAYDFKIVIDKK